MTREEIIEQLDSIIGTYEILMGNGVNSDILDVDDIEAIREAISALSENKGEWIPVSERLPEENTKVYLVCFDDGYISSIMYDRGKWLIGGNNIIAWMPLPEPYKKGGE